MCILVVKPSPGSSDGLRSSTFPGAGSVGVDFDCGAVSVEYFRVGWVFVPKVLEHPV